MWAAIQETAHLAGALPLAACALLMLRALVWKRFARPSPDVVLLAAAFAVSFVADSIGAAMQEAGTPNQWLQYVYAPIQFGLLALVIFAPAVSRRIVALWFALIVATSLAVADWMQPETVIQVLAGAWVGIVALGHPGLARYRWPVLLYCWGAIPFLLALSAVEPALAWPWIVAWVGYQTVRVVALAWVTWAVIQTPQLRLLEVVHERGGGTTRRRAGGHGKSANRGIDLSLGGDRRLIVARATPRKRRAG